MPQRRISGEIRLCQGVRRESRRKPKLHRHGAHQVFAPDGQGGLREDRGRKRPATDLFQPRRSGGRVVQNRQKNGGSGRYRRRHRLPFRHPHRRADDACQAAGAGHQSDHPAARKVPRSARYRVALSSTLSGYDHESGGQTDLFNALQNRQPNSPLLRRARFFGGGNPDDAPDPRGCECPPLHHPSQRARSRPLSSYRAGTLSQTPHRRRFRSGV